MQRLIYEIKILIFEIHRLTVLAKKFNYYSLNFEEKVWIVKNFEIQRLIF